MKYAPPTTHPRFFKRERSVVGVLPCGWPAWLWTRLATLLLASANQAALLIQESHLRGGFLPTLWVPWNQLSPSSPAAARKPVSTVGAITPRWWWTRQMIVRS